MESYRPSDSRANFSQPTRWPLIRRQLWVGGRSAPCAVFFGGEQALGPLTTLTSNMLDTLRKLLGSTPETPGASAAATDRANSPDVRLAACVLLVELANVDGEFSALERQRIFEILQRHFGVDTAGAEQLMAEAAVASRRSVDDFTFTRQVVRDYDLGQRMVLAELMWQVVLADGKLAGDESYLMRKFANLLDLEPAFLSEARKRTEQAM